MHAFITREKLYSQENLKTSRLQLFPQVTVVNSDLAARKMYVHLAGTHLPPVDILEIKLHLKEEVREVVLNTAI